MEWYNSNIDLLLTINFLHSACTGILLPNLPRHIMRTGGNQFMIGILHSVVYICQNLTEEVLALLPQGKVSTLGFSLFGCFIYAFVLVFDNTILMCFIIRCLYALTADVIHVSKALVKHTEPPHQHIKFFNLIDISKTFGIATGFILGGYVFECNRDYSSNAMVASCLFLVCIILLENVNDNDCHISEPVSQFYQIPSICYEKLKRIENTDFSQKYFSFTLKTLYTFAFTVFLTRFVFILLNSYEISASFLGYILAYDTMVLFLCQGMVPFIKTKISNDKKLFKYNMVIGGGLLIGIVNAPTYQCYMILYVILMFSYTLVNSLFQDDVLNFKSDEDVNEADKTLTVLINIFTPTFSGFIVYLLGRGALKLTILIPVSVYLYIITIRDLQCRHEAEDDDIYQN